MCCDFEMGISKKTMNHYSPKKYVKKNKQKKESFRKCHKGYVGQDVLFQTADWNSHIYCQILTQLADTFWVAR